jgi:hypothetical protein
MAVAWLPQRAIAADSIYDAVKISVDMTAKDAVAARSQGMAKAARRGLDIVLKRLVPLSALPQLPPLGDTEIDAMLNGVSIRAEQNSTTRYVATLDVSFNGAAVRQYLEKANVPYGVARAPSISILPLVIEGGAVKSEGEEGWLQAWEALDIPHSMTPATILRPRPTLDVETVKALLAGNAQAYDAMQADYGYAPLVVAVGQKEEGVFVTRLAGADAVGAINFGREDKLQGLDAKEAAANAAAVAFGIIENRWKVTQAHADAPATKVRYEREPGAEARAPAEVPRNVAAVVEFSGLKDWQDMRSRLMRVAGLQALEVNSLSARAASVTFDYAGPLGELQSVLAENGFSFGDRNGTFVLRNR